MRDYAVVHGRSWIEPAMRALRGDHLAQALALYLVTGPNATMSGVYYCPVAYAAEDLGSPLEATREAFRRVEEAGICIYDCDLGWVFVCGMAPTQMQLAPQASLDSRDNRAKALAREINQIASHMLKLAFYETYGQRFAAAFQMSGWPPEAGSSAAPPEVPRRPMQGASEAPRSQEQEQEQDQRQEHPVGGKPPTPPRGSAHAETELPDWMPKAEWEAFVEMRRKMGKSIPFTLAAAKGIVRKLGELRDLGHDPAAVLEASTRNGWRDVFAIKNAQIPQGGARAAGGGRYAGAAAAVFGNKTQQQGGEVIDV